MEFDFDPEKNLKNTEQHGIDFREVQKLWEGPHVILPAKHVTGENRYAILGKIKGKVYLGIYTERRDTIRIISCHRADQIWERRYYEYLTKDEAS